LMISAAMTSEETTSEVMTLVTTSKSLIVD
jgi:hypothetical protein